MFRPFTLKLKTRTLLRSLLITYPLSSDSDSSNTISIRKVPFPLEKRGLNPQTPHLDEPLLDRAKAQHFRTIICILALSKNCKDIIQRNWQDFTLLVIMLVSYQRTELIKNKWLFLYELGPAEGKIWWSCKQFPSKL